MRNTLTLILVLGAATLGLTACGQEDPNAACRDGFGSNAVAVGNGDDERFCTVNGSPVGEVEKDGFQGWQADD